MSSVRLLPYMIALLCSYLGWKLGRPVSFFTAYVVAVVGAAVGLYVGRRMVARILS